MESSTLIAGESMQDVKGIDPVGDDAVWRRLIISEHHETKWKIIACTLAAALAFTWLPILILVR